jgi:hypothetical protein
MPYLTSSHMPSGSLAGYHAITDALSDSRPEGMVARYVGECDDGGLAITVVWSSRAHADRFETEQLIPTVQRLMGPRDPQSSTTSISYEATEVVFAASDDG